MLEFNIKNQTISRVDRFNPATDSVDYLTAKFNFLTADWDGKTKKALFRSGTVSYEAAINASGVCNVPFEVLVSPENKFSVLSGGWIKIFVSVVGTSGTVQIPTKECRVEIGASGLTETLNGATPTPNIYEQFVDTIKADNDTTVAEIKADNDETRAEVEALTERAETAQTSAEQSAARMKNDYANSIKGKVNGEVVRVDDVSPIAHNLVVKSHGKNLFDISKFKVSENTNTAYPYITSIGEGYIDITVEDTYNGNGHIAFDLKLKNVCPQMVAGKTYFISANSDAWNKCLYLKQLDYFWNFGNALTITEEMLECTLGLYGYATYRGQSAGTCRISNIQIELGDIATEYTPYIDPSTVTLTRCGKNLAFGGETPSSSSSGITLTRTEGLSTFVINGTAEKAISMGATKPVLLQSGTYTVSVYGLNRISATFDRCYVLKHADKSVIVNEVMTNNPKSFTLTEPTEVAISFALAEKTSYSNKIIHLQMEHGNVATEYVECEKMATHTPSTDGTCDVVSLSPTMTLLTDTEGVTVECEYNRDANKVFDDYVLTDEAKTEIAAIVESDVAEVLSALNGYAESVMGGGS